MYKIKNLAEYYKIVVVILNWNGRKYLEKFLPNVIENSKGIGFGVVVVDNASTDDSIQLLNRSFESIPYIILDKNYGFAGGYNEGLKQIKAEYYILLNSDVEVSQDWILPIMKILDSDKNYACAMPKIRNYSDKKYFEYAGAAGGYIDKFGFPFCKGRIFDNIESDDSQYDINSEIFWASGAAMFIRSSDYWNAGGLDEDFFAHMEEIDLCWRLKNMGKQILYCSQSVVYHVGGGTLSKTNSFKTYLNFRNNLYLLYKNLPERKFFQIMFLRRVLDGLAATRFFIKGEFKNFWAVFSAHIHFYKNLSKLKAKRKKNLIMFNKSEHPEMYKGSIAIAYYIKKKRIFRELDF